MPRYSGAIERKTSGLPVANMTKVRSPGVLYHGTESIHHSSPLCWRSCRRPRSPPSSCPHSRGAGPYHSSATSGAASSVTFSCICPASSSTWQEPGERRVTAYSSLRPSEHLACCLGYGRESMNLPPDPTPDLPARGASEADGSSAPRQRYPERRPVLSTPLPRLLRLLQTK